MAHGLIVVGADGSEESKAALKWALAEARLRNASVRVLHAWFAFPQLVAGTPITSEDWDLLRDSADEFVKTFVSDTIGEPADVKVTAVAVHDTAAPALVEAAKDAELLVVGSRGLGGFKGLLLGSVSAQCVHRATCPVVIVRGTLVEQRAKDEQLVGSAVDG